MPIKRALQVPRPAQPTTQPRLTRQYTQLTMSPSEISEMIDWIAKLPELGRLLRGDKGAHARRGLERYAREYLQRPECRVYKRETWSSHSFMDEGYYERESVRFALMDRIKTLR